jgi:acetylornithine deacetylase/succinyl-diaminopimelate desuccinylase-like protein
VVTVPLREEATQLLSDLIRLDTVNPPGNETKAAELLQRYLEAAGVECELLARVPHRANLIARLRGRGDGPTLMLLSHTDTVPADPGEWSTDPWGGTVRDGHVWGRGALDMKSQVAASAVALTALAREGFEPAGDVLFAACADEEVGEDFGLSWLCREHPDAVRADYCINEGGGDRVVMSDLVLYMCATAEKMSSPFLLRVNGRSGHASLPSIADNALVKAARLIERLAALPPETHLLPETTKFFTTVFGDMPSPDEALVRLRELDSVLAATVEPMLATTIAPTMIEASKTRNVIPAVCDLVCDCRLLPGQTQEDAERTIRAQLGEDSYELLWLEGSGGTRSELETPLWEAIESFVSQEEPGARVAPVICPGFTDSHWLREAFGTVAYGFFPLRTMDAKLAARLVHSADERIAVDDLELGARFLIHAVRTLEA